MLTLYNVPVSIYGVKVRILMRHKGLLWDETVPPGGYGSAAYKQVVPSGNVPALVDEDLLLADSEAIAEYLEERHPDPAMLPGDIALRAKTRELSRFHDTRLEPEVRALFKMTAPEQQGRLAIERQSRAINDRLAQLALMVDRRRRNRRQAGQNGEAAATATHCLPLTLGDCGFPGTCAWIEEMTGPLGLEIEWPGAVRAYLARLQEQTAVSVELGIYRPVIAAWIAAKAKG